MNRNQLIGITFLIKCQLEMQGNQTGGVQSKIGCIHNQILIPLEEARVGSVAFSIKFQLKMKGNQLGELRAISAAFSIKYESEINGNQAGGAHSRISCILK